MATRILSGLAACGVGGNLMMRYTDSLAEEKKDPFSKHTIQQQKKHWISGMHEPYLPTEEQRAFFTEHFSSVNHLIPASSDELGEALKAKTPVRIRELSKCPFPTMPDSKRGTVVVGGPPALLSTAFEKGVTYINSGNPIWRGSAFHLEWDAESEAPTSYQPLHFMADQLKRVIFPEFLKTIEQTGHVSWRSLDWWSWIKNPSKWMVGIRVAIAFQRFTGAGPNPESHKEVTMRTQRHEHFYNILDAEENHELMMPGQGSVYIARNAEEERGLFNMEEGLIKEGRKFPFLSEKELLGKFGFLPKGVIFGEKLHDRTLSPNFLKVLSERIVRHGGEVIEGTVKAVYTDDPDQGGVLEYQTNDGKIHYIPFNKLVMSLGAQQVLGVDDKPFFDIVSARGVSTIALLHLPAGSKLPAATVCGGTNHVTKLAEPFVSEEENIFPVRITCGACIAPTSDSADYDGAAMVGLRKAVSKVLKGRVEILTVYGCNRQVSQYGQIHWLKVPKTLKVASKTFVARGGEEDIGCTLPKKGFGIFIAYGAGGGGLTQGPSLSE